VKLLVKLGGTLLDAPESRLRLAAEIAEVMASGVRVVVVHGGGRQMTRFLAERGVESRFVNGLRVTSDEVLDAVLKVFAGTVNHELVAAFAAAGIRAVGLTGMDGFLTEAEPLDPALGFVGKPVRSDPALLELLTSRNYLPVVACVGGDRAGRFFNVNADQMAAACVAAFEADRLLFLTDVDGVRGVGQRVYRELTPSQCERLIASDIATGGMRAKLDAAMDALRQGVPRVVIAPGALPGVTKKLLAGESLGTALVADEQKVDES
jgi:acetylglutamate kinase